MAGKLSELTITTTPDASGYGEALDSATNKRATWINFVKAVFNAGFTGTNRKYNSSTTGAAAFGTTTIVATLTAVDVGGGLGAAAYFSDGTNPSFVVAPLGFATPAGTYGVSTPFIYTNSLLLPPVTPSQITSNQNNYSPGTKAFQRWSSDASRNVTGMVAGTDGETRRIYNVGAQNIVLKHQDTNSTAANRWLCESAADITMGADTSVLATYDTTTACWRVRS